MTSELGILKRLIVKGNKAFADPAVARALLLPASFRDSFIRTICTEIWLCDGDWISAKQALSANRTLDQQRLDKLFKWASQIKAC